MIFYISLALVDFSQILNKCFACSWQRRYWNDYLQITWNLFSFQEFLTAALEVCTFICTYTFNRNGKKDIESMYIQGKYLILKKSWTISIISQRTYLLQLYFNDGLNKTKKLLLEFLKIYIVCPRLEFTREKKSLLILWQNVILYKNFRLLSR